MPPKLEHESVDSTVRISNVYYLFEVLEITGFIKFYKDLIGYVILSLKN